MRGEGKHTETALDRITDFFAMGGYAAFVWPAYLITGLVLIGLLAHALYTVRRRERTLAALRASLHERKETGR